MPKFIQRQQKPVEAFEVLVDEEGHITNRKQLIKWLNKNYPGYEEYNVFKNGKEAERFMVCVNGESRCWRFDCADTLIKGVHKFPDMMPGGDFWIKYEAVATKKDGKHIVK